MESSLTFRGQNSTKENAIFNDSKNSLNSSQDFVFLYMATCLILEKSYELF